MNAASIAWRIRTDRLLLRGWRESDAPALSQVILENFEHLHPWMPWAGDHEQQSVEAKLKFIRTSRGEFLKGKTLGFAIFGADERGLLGSVGLHARIGSGAREIGYWIARDHLRRGLATEAAGALTRLAFEQFRVRLVEIHCDPTNEPSSGVARRLGFALRTTMRNCVPRPGMSPRDNMMWMLHRDQFADSEAARIFIRVDRGDHMQPIA